MKLLAGLLVAGALYGERVAVPLTDASRPSLVKASTVNGGITVRTHSGKDVIVEFGGSESHRGLVIEEEKNVILIRAGGSAGNASMTLTVPVKTSLNLRAVNGSGILVEGVHGEIDVHSVNGRIALNDIAGTAVAHAVNGTLAVILKEVTSGQLMSFSTINGNVDVTLPANVKGNIQSRSVHGKVLSEFNMGPANGGGPEITFRSMNGTIYIRKGAVR